LRRDPARSGVARRRSAAACGSTNARCSYSGKRRAPIPGAARARDAWIQEAIMAHAQLVAPRARTPARRIHRARPRDDTLDPVRGIMIGALLSIAGFWLPLALVLAR
jgi:hypothetical protein